MKPLHPQVRIVDAGYRRTLYVVELHDGDVWEYTHSSPLPRERAEARARWLSDVLEHAQAQQKAQCVEALREAHDVLSLCITRRVAEPEDALVATLGESIGYGALMSAASRVWARMFDGTPQEGSQHTTGPAEATVTRAKKMIAAALKGVRDA